MLTFICNFVGKCILILIVMMKLSNEFLRLKQSLNRNEYEQIIECDRSSKASGSNLLVVNCWHKGLSFVRNVAVAVAVLMVAATTATADEPSVSQLPEIEMVYVEGGTFTMGATLEQDRDAYYRELPTHIVALDSYYIGKYEVTQRLWKAVMGNNPSAFVGDDLPVECVSWNDVQEFLSKLNRMTGKKYRLPTEAEWEFAARGGNRSCGYNYSGGNSIGDVAWCAWNSDSKTHAVGTKSPNELGIYDMSGNVLEWCQDWYGSYSSSSQRNPKGPNSGSYRVYRGGSWCDYGWLCRVSYRKSSDHPFYGGNRHGFRLALSM